jgi:hypothetical protein
MERADSIVLRRFGTSGSGQLEAIVVHHLVPRSHEVLHELLLRVLLRVKLGDGAQLGVRAEDEVDGGAGPLELACGAVATLVHVLIRAGCLPLRAHVEQVHEEVIGQRLRPLGEDAVLRPTGFAPDIIAKIDIHPC